MSSAERLYREFQLFHSENPQVYDLFKRFVAQAIRANKEAISARFIIERVRWEITVAINRGRDDFRINNNHAPFYARLYLRENPEHIDLFDLRESVADESLPIPGRAA